MRGKRQARWMTGLFWVVLIATVLVLVAMRIWARPEVRYQGAVLPIFDARPGGYDLDAARTYLTAISDDEKRIYLDVLQKLDLAFPLLLAVSIGWSIRRFVPREWGRGRYLLPLVVIPALVTDYVENLAVAGILTSTPADLSPDLVRFASSATRTKFAFLALEFIAIAVLIAMFAYRRWMIRKP